MMDFPRVSDILAPYRQDLAAIPEYILQPATERGSMVHKIVAALAQGLWIPRIPEECAGYVASWQGWFERYVEEALFVERRLYHPTYFYTGQIDLYCYFKGIGPVLIDYKTPVQHQKTWQAQLAAYKELIPEPTLKAGTLQLHPEGKPPKMIWLEDANQAFNAFLGALGAYFYFNGG